MLIILEGPDCAGKTTLANALVKQLDAELLHRGPPTRHPLDEYVTPLLEYRPGTERHIICDRWHWGEWVYPPILKRKTQMTLGVRRYIEMFLKMRGAVVVHVTDTPRAVKLCLVERGDTLIQPKHVDELLTRFNTMAQASFMQVCRPDEDVVAIARFAEQRARYFTPFTTPVGALAPDVLLLGDVRGPRSTNPLDTALMPYPATSGAYLMKALDEHAELLKCTTIANQCDGDDTFHLWERLGKPAVVALGVNASISLEVNGMPHATVPHPQYVRRFHSRAAAEYGQLIADVATTERNEIGWRP